MKRILLSLSLSLAGVALATAQTAYTLPQILDSARRNNVAITSGLRRVSAATEQRKEAFTKYFPTVSGTGAWFNSNKSLISASVDPATALPSELSAALAQTLPAEALAALDGPISINLVKNGVLGGLTAVQPVFAGGRIVNSNRLARVGQESERLQLRLSQNEVERAAEAYFWQMASIEEKLKTVAAVEAMLADLHKDVAVSVSAGVALRNDLLQVELRQNETESSELKLRNGLSLVRMLLAQFCGLRDTSFQLAYDSAAVVPVARCDHEASLPTTAEYHLLEKRVEAAALQKRLAVGENLPTLAVGAGYSYNDLLDKGQSRAVVFATLRVPLSDWWGGSHAVRRRKLEYQNAVEERKDRSELLLIRMQNAWNSVVEARKQLDIARRSIEQSAENLRLHRDFYRVGTATMSDLLEAQTLYRQALDRRTDAFADYQNRVLEYRHAVGQ